jgi:hypothetical protein
MSTISHDAGDNSVIIASIHKMQKQLLCLHASLLRRVKRIEAAERSPIAIVTLPVTPAVLVWTCPVCFRPFNQRDSLKGHVRYDGNV